MSSNVTVPDVARSVGVNAVRTSRTLAAPSGAVTVFSSVVNPDVVSGAVSTLTVLSTAPVPFRYTTPTDGADERPVVFTAAVRSWAWPPATSIGALVQVGEPARAA